LTQISSTNESFALARRLYRYRWLIYSLVLRDLKLRYRGSVLGFAWTLINPLIFMGVYTLVFSVFLRAGIKDFPLFLLSGLLPWTWLSNALQQGSGAIVAGRMYVGKTLFPTEALIVVPVVSNLVNFLLSLPVFVVIAVLLHGHLGVALLALPLLIALQCAMTFGLVTVFATLNVFYRDVQQLVAHLLMLGFFLTPIFYAPDSIPASIRPWALANPFATMVIAYRSVLFENSFPGIDAIAYLTLAGLVLLGCGHLIYSRCKDSFGEYL
jgi:ABC-type polysaccharide/polyol phosphate export permease